MRFPTRPRWIAAVGIAILLAALGLLLMIRFLVPLTLEVASQWAGVLGLVLAYVLAVGPGVAWFARSTRPAITPAETLDPVPLLERRRQESLVRTRDAWIGLGVSEAAVLRLEQLAPDNDLNLKLPAHGMVLVAGELGAGKSFLAESLHRQHIDAVVESGVGPWPSLLFARDLAGSDLAVAILSVGPPGWSGGYRVFLDGCDEVSRDEAARLHREARIFAGLHQDSLIVLLARPGYVSAAEEITVPQMPEKALEHLMSAVAGYDVTMSQISRQMHDTVRRPLFAILYARLNFRQLRSMTTAGLLAAMVEDVLHRDRATSHQLFSTLRSLASRTISHDGRLPSAEAGGLDHREELLGTRLVVLRDSALRFAAPVLEQYFAAQALLLDEVDTSRQLASLREWELWRPAWVMAVATGSWDDTYRLVAPLVARHPGAAAWLVHQAIPDPAIVGRHDATIDARAVEQRLQRALDTWCTAISEVTLRSTGQRGAPKLIVRTYAHGTAFLGAWAGQTPPTETQIRDGMRLLHSAEGWWSRRTIRAGSLPAWPWRTTLSLAAEMVSSVIKNVAKDADAPSLRDEHMWTAIRHMAPVHLRYQLSGKRDRSMVHAATVAEVEKHIARFEHDQPVRYRLNGREFRLADLVALKEYLLATLAANLDDPWPGPNNPPTDGAWSGYDLDQLVARTTAVYAAAFDAYAHIVRTWLPRLADTLELAILLPVRMKAYVDADRHGPGIYFELWPRPLGDANQFDIVPGAAPPQPWDETKLEYLRFAHDVEQWRPESAAWVHGFGVDAVLDVFGDRPATKLVFKWLWDDLNDVYLVEPSRPAFTY